MSTYAKKKAKPAAPAKKSKFSFFGEVISELKKVRWPTRQETVRLSILVLVITILAGAILGGVDYGFAKLVKGLLLGG
jgi:preprotein translocase subunit SecE